MSSEVAELELLVGGPPAEWQQVTLGKVVRIVTDGTSAVDLAALPEVHHYSLPAFDEGAGPEVGPGDTIKSNKTIVPSDCVLFSKLNPRIPRIWRVRGDPPPHSFCSTEFWPLVAQGSGVDLDYLTHYLSSAAFLGHPDITPSSSTNSHQRVDRKAFERFEFVLPPLDEQRRIAEVLRSVDEAIAAANEAQLFSEQVFANVRAELMEGARQECNEIEVVDAIAKNRGQKITKLQTSDYLDDGAFPIIDQGASFICGYTDDVEALWPYDLPVIVFGDHTRILKFVDFPFVIGADGTQCITPQAGIDARFLYYALQSLDLRGEGYARHFKLLKEQTIPMPHLREQREIAAQLLALETSISAAAQSTQRLVTVKQSLMADLLSGRVRVPA